MPSFAVDGVHQNKSHFTYILVIHWSNLWQLVEFSTISILRYLYVVKSNLDFLDNHALTTRSKLTNKMSEIIFKKYEHKKLFSIKRLANF